MKGRAPVRRTIEYLEKGAFAFKKNIQIMTIHYNLGHNPSQGLYFFQFWHVPQIQYQNPNVQILTFKNMTPTPFIQFFMDDGRKALVDVYNKSQTEIYDHVKKIFCKSEETLAEEAKARERLVHPANFGYGCSRWCICEIPGQVPCSAFSINDPQLMGKNSWQLEKQKEKEEQENF